MKIVVSLLFWLLSAVNASAVTCPAVPATSVTYYVATNEAGASNTTCNGLHPTNTGGANCPFKDFTAPAVREKLHSTDVGQPTKNVTVKVRTGTYIIEPLELFPGEPVTGIYINANGANANEFVVLTNYNGEVVTLDGTCGLGIPECNFPLLPGRTGTLMEMYGDRIVVQGLRFRNVADRNAQIGSSNTFFQCNDLADGEDSLKNTASTGPATIYGNTFSGAVQAIDATLATNWTVSFNTISNGVKGVGMKVNATNSTISNNTFSNLTAEAISLGGAGSIDHPSDYEAANLTASNNLIHNVGIGVQVFWCSGCQIVNNQITGASQLGIFFGSDETTQQSGCRNGLGCLVTTGSVVTGNTFRAITGNNFIYGKSPQMVSGLTAGTNNYCITSGSAVFRWGTSDLDFDEWKTATGTDSTSALNCPGSSLGLIGKVILSGKSMVQ